ncbi:tRNA (guanosine(37)-N1)-methyltransferase TrmD [Candidatus Woesebacteria bacterium]|nr:tRNA (guanosine(37)-N1)-methyltransferase TrmD [Candidatus Woesebacteria bacterium]
MRIDIITLFPDFFEAFKTHSIIGRAIKAGKIELHLHNMRDEAKDKYGSVDDHPYGGGPGMVLRVDVVVPMIKRVKELNEGAPIILMTPQGEKYTQGKARTLASESGLILVCGHYEGFDERIREYATQEISIGDYVLTGGELASMVITDSVVRLLPGVLGDDTSSHDESHSEGLLEYPQYTRPLEYEGKKVPEILTGGNHKEIDKWRMEQSRERTKIRRPDLLK